MSIFIKITFTISVAVISLFVWYIFCVFGYFFFNLFLLPIIEERILLHRDYVSEFEIQKEELEFVRDLALRDCKEGVGREYVRDVWVRGECETVWFEIDSVGLGFSGLQEAGYVYSEEVPEFWSFMGDCVCVKCLEGTGIVPNAMWDTPACENHYDGEYRVYQDLGKGWYLYHRKEWS